MNEKINWQFLLSDSRARIYVLWAVLCAVGFTAAHFGIKDWGINSFWLVLNAIGLGYMYKVMPLRVKAAQKILYVWAIPIIIGMIVSYACFYVSALNFIAPYLGAFWLYVMAVSFALNGLFDEPAGWYWVAAGLNAIAGIAVLAVPELLAGQWLIAAIVSTWAMLNLWIFRTS